MKTKFLFLAINSARPAIGKVLIGLACNTAEVAPITDEQDGFVQLAPYGDTPYYHEGPDGKLVQYTQRFQRENADAMVKAFNAVVAKKGASYKGLPIYSGHPDADRTRWPDERRLGGVMALQARDNGLYVKPAWNSLGEENRREAFLVYPSPAWLYDGKMATNSQLISPTELRSVGMTNTPRIQDSIPWVNSDDPNAPDTNSQAETNNPVTPIDHKKMLTGLLGLKDDASDDDITTAHGAHMDVKAAKDKLETAHTKLSKAYDKHEEAMKALQVQNTAANSERDAALADVTKFRALTVGTLLNTAITAGRITAAERPALETAFNADFDAAKKTLDDKKPALNTQRLDLQPNRDDLSTPALRSFAYNSRADELRREMNLKTEDEITAAMRGDDKGKVIIAAMEAAAK